jgi:cell division protein FtsA
MAKPESHIAGLDVGTTNTIAIVAEPKESGELHVVGIGTHPSRGLRKGVVINLEATAEAIRKAVEEAELMAGVQIERTYAAVAGGHLKGFNSNGVVAISGRSKEIRREDVNRAVSAAKNVTIAPDREVLHVIPQEYKVDSQEGIGDPVGMTGERLEVSVHIITGSKTSNQNLITSINKAGMDVIGMVAGPLAAAETVLTTDEKDLGVALLDIGGGTTDLSVFQNGSLVHTSVLPLGGDNFTNDIAVGLRTSISEAEYIKQGFGCALGHLVQESEMLEVPSMGGRKPRLLTRKLLSEIIQPRAEEILDLAFRDVRNSENELKLHSGIVITGGGATLLGLPELAEQIFELPVRVGRPTQVKGMAEAVSDAEFATAVGLTRYVQTHPDAEAYPSQLGAGHPRMTSFGGRVREWFATMF